jgi:hypothetical protein
MLVAGKRCEAPMKDRAYWLDLFTGKTWDEFLRAGGDVSGFRSGRWKTAQQIRVGDYLLCYLTGASRWLGVLEVTRPAQPQHSPVLGGTG